MTVADDSLEAAMAERLTRAARATQDLCDVLWEALHEELSDRSPNGPRAQRVADLSQRVADVSATVMALVRYGRPDVHEREPSPTAELPTEPAPEPELAVVSAPARTPPAATGASDAVIVDERAEQETRARPLPWDKPPSEEMRVTRRGTEEPATISPPDSPF
jgi:hypothetical protein